MSFMKSESDYREPVKIFDSMTTLFVGDLSVICDEIKLYQLFSLFGDVETVQLKKSDRDPQRAHLGFGFIKFRTHESAERALKEMNGYFFLGRAMIVDWTVDYGKKKSSKFVEKTFNSEKRQPTAQIHVMFVTRELNRRVSELDLGGVFSRYGNLVDIAIKKNAINYEHGVQSGYAFLHFALTSEGLKSAITAVEEVNNLVVDNIAYQCKMTHSLQTHLLSMKYSEAKSGDGIKNLSFTHPPYLIPGPTVAADSSFKTYESPFHRMNSPRPIDMSSLPQQHSIQFFPPNNLNSGRGCSGKNFHTSGIDPTDPTVIRAPHSHEHSSYHLPSNLDYLHTFETTNESNAMPKSLKKISDDFFNRQQSSVGSNLNYSSSSHQQYHDHHQVVVEPLSFSSSEDPLRRRNNNNMMTHPYEDYFQQKKSE